MIFIRLHNLSAHTEKALARLCGCAHLSEPLLVASGISNKIICSRLLHIFIYSNIYPANNILSAKCPVIYFVSAAYIQTHLRQAP